jgi:predicted NodU family carbamoyl transferase
VSEEKRTSDDVARDIYNLSGIMCRHALLTKDCIECKAKRYEYIREHEILCRIEVFGLCSDCKIEPSMSARDLCFSCCGKYFEHKVENKEEIRSVDHDQSHGASLFTTSILTIIAIFAFILVCFTIDGQ